MPRPLAECGGEWSATHASPLRNTIPLRKGEALPRPLSECGGGWRATHASPLRNTIPLRRGEACLALFQGTAADGGRRMRRPYAWADSLQHQIELQDLVIGDRRVLDAVAGGLAVSTHGVEAIADHAGSKPMPRVRHGRKHLPLVAPGIVRFHRLEGREEALILHFTPCHQHMIAVEPARDRASRRRHSCARRPEVRSRIVHLDEIHIVAGTRYETRADAPTDGIQFVPGADYHVVIAGEQGRPDRLP